MTTIYGSKNEYLTERVTNYTAIERTVPKSEAIFTAGCVVALCGFDMRYVGSRVLIDLLAKYVTEEQLCIENCISDIAERDGVESSYISSCIEACIRDNEKFGSLASKLLEIPDSEIPTDIPEVVDVLYAVYKIYYNYSVYDDAPIDDITAE